MPRAFPVPLDPFPSG